MVLPAEVRRSAARAAPGVLAAAARRTSFRAWPCLAPAPAATSRRGRPTTSFPAPCSLAFRGRTARRPASPSRVAPAAAVLTAVPAPVETEFTEAAGRLEAAVHRQVVRQEAGRRGAVRAVPPAGRETAPAAAHKQEEMDLFPPSAPRAGDRAPRPPPQDQPPPVHRQEGPDRLGWPVARPGWRLPRAPAWGRTRGRLTRRRTRVHPAPHLAGRGRCRASGAAEVVEEERRDGRRMRYSTAWVRHRRLRRRRRRSGDAREP